MRTARVLAVVACLVFALAPANPAAAQDLAKLCEQALKVRAGQWAEYQMSGAQGAGRMRVAVIGSQDVAGAKAWWIEMKMAGDSGTMIMQVLAGGYPFRTDQIHELVVKMAGQPAMKMPRQSLDMMRGQLGAAPSMGVADECKKARVVGTESVTVPAGTFRALHLEPTDANTKKKANVWASEEIPFGMIKAVHPDGEIVLLGHGQDAKSSISETPISMPGFGGG
jgi:hypothetical protein